MTHAISFEVSRGEYVRNVRKRQRVSLRQLADDMNALLPSNEHVSHSWISRLEDDSPHTTVSALRALALARRIPIDITLLGVSAEDVDAVRQLVTLHTTPPPDGRRTVRKRSSSCIADRVGTEFRSGLVSRIPVAA